MNDVQLMNALIAQIEEVLETSERVQNAPRVYRLYRLLGQLDYLRDRYADLEPQLEAIQSQQPRTDYGRLVMANAQIELRRELNRLFARFAHLHPVVSS